MMTRSTTIDLEYFDNPSYYDKLQAISRDSAAVSYILWSVLSCISTAISFVGAFILLHAVNPIYGLLMLIASLPASIATARYTKLLYLVSIQQVNEYRQMSYCQRVASERGFAKDVRLFDAGERLSARYRRIWNVLFLNRKNVVRMRSVLTALLMCLPEGVIILIGLDIALGVLNQYNTVGDYALIVGLAGQLWASISLFSSATLQIYDNKLKIDNMRQLDNFKNRISDTGTLALICVESITFENVSFTYPGTNTPALSNISFSICKNEKLMLVGLNGSGKSTLIKLILRLYEPDAGIIRINGTDIRSYRIGALRANFSVFFQDALNYHFSLRENFDIADAVQQDTDANIKNAITKAHGEDILAKASKGLDTGVTRLFDPSGIELSVGQHQKLALARSFYRKHSALILDEPSSSLDPKAEHEIFETLKDITDGKMTIFTSHRLSNATLADRVIVLQGGVLVEDGTPNELLKNKNLYAELVHYQREKYIL